MTELQPMRRLVDQLLAAAPKAALVLGVLLAGLIASALLRRLARWAVRHTGLEAAAERAGVAKVLYGVGLKRGLAHFLGQMVWIAGLLFTFAAVAELLGLPAVAAATGAIIGFLPKILAAGAVLVGGLLFGGVLRNLLLRIGRDRADLESPRFVAALVYYLTLTVSVIMAVQQVGLETDLVNALVKIVVAGVTLAAGVAFALGSWRALQNVVARYYCRRVLRPGDRVRVGEREGVLLRFSAVSAIIRGDERELIVPCSVLLEQPLEVERGTGIAPPRERSAPP